MSSTFLTSLMRVLTVAVVGMSLAGCGDAIQDAIPEEPSTTAASLAKPTSTTTVPATTTMVPPTTTTTLDLEIPDDVREILTTQADAVAVDFLNRLNRVGPRSDYIPLEAGDPFAGAALDALQVGEQFHNWAIGCYEMDWCQVGDWEPESETRGRVETLIPAGEGLVQAYGDGTYYLDGVYTGTLGLVRAAPYATGFRFVVEDGRAVLIDVVTKPDVALSFVGNWLSALDDTSSELSLEPTIDGLSAEVTATHLSSDTPSYNSQILVVAEVSNSSDTQVFPYAAGSEISGAHAELYNSTMAEFLEEMEGSSPDGWSFVYGADVDPGETETILIKVLFLAEHKGAGSFFVPIYDARSGNSADEATQILSLRLDIGEVSYCEKTVFPDTILAPGECSRAPMLDHQWRD